MSGGLWGLCSEACNHYNLEDGQKGQQEAVMYQLPLHQSSVLHSPPPWHHTQASL